MKTTIIYCLILFGSFIKVLTYEMNIKISDIKISNAILYIWLFGCSVYCTAKIIEKIMKTIKKEG